MCLRLMGLRMSQFLEVRTPPGQRSMAAFVRNADKASAAGAAAWPLLMYLGPMPNRYIFIYRQKNLFVRHPGAEEGIAPDSPNNPSESPCSGMSLDVRAALNMSISEEQAWDQAHQVEAKPEEAAEVDRALAQPAGHKRHWECYFCTFAGTNIVLGCFTYHPGIR